MKRHITILIALAMLAIGLYGQENPAPVLSSTFEYGHLSVTVHWTAPTPPVENAPLYGYNFYTAIGFGGVFFDYELKNYDIISATDSQGTPITSYTVYDFSEFMSYRLKMTAVYGTESTNVESELSTNYLEFTPINGYPSPQMPDVEPGSTYGVATISWTAPDTQHAISPLWGYVIYSYEDGEYTAIDFLEDDTAGDKQIDISNLDLEVEYTFAIVAVYGTLALGANDGLTQILAATVSEPPTLFLSEYTYNVNIELPAPYPRPVGFALYEFGDQTISLEWQAPDLSGMIYPPEIFGYLLYQYTTDYTAIAFIDAFDNGIEITNFTYPLTNLVNGTTYTYALTALYGSYISIGNITVADILVAIGDEMLTESNKTSNVSATPVNPATLPVPSALMLLGVDYGYMGDDMMITLQWANPVYGQTVAPPLHHFDILIDGVFVNNNFQVESELITTYVYTLEFGVEYTVTVVAVYGEGYWGPYVESLPSAPITFTGVPPRDKVFGLSYTLTGYAVDLAWHAPWENENAHDQTEPPDFLGYFVTRYSISLQNFIESGYGLNDYNLYVFNPVILTNTYSDDIFITDPNTTQNATYIYCIYAVYEGDDYSSNPEDIVMSNAQRILVTVKTTTAPFTETFEESNVVIDDTITNEYQYFFDGWYGFTGDLDTDVTIGQGNYWTSNFSFANNFNNTSGLSTSYIFNGWVVTPTISLGNADAVTISFDLALTAPGARTAPILTDEYVFAVVVSDDNGATWSANNILRAWWTGVVIGPEYMFSGISSVGQQVTILVSDITGNIRIGLYAGSDIDATGIDLEYYTPDAEIHIDNFSVSVTHSEHNPTIQPMQTALLSNYPNPFNPVTTISYTVAKDSPVSIDVYNIKGQKVKNLVNDIHTAGTHKITWNGKDTQGRDVASGVYFYRLNSGGLTDVKKMLLMK